MVDTERPISVKHALMHMTGIGPGPKEARLDFAGLVSGNARRSERTRLPNASVRGASVVFPRSIDGQSSETIELPPR